jgi:hypothetical protein
MSANDPKRTFQVVAAMCALSELSGRAIRDIG